MNIRARVRFSYIDQSILKQCLLTDVSSISRLSGAPFAADYVTPCHVSEEDNSQMKGEGLIFKKKHLSKGGLNHFQLGLLKCYAYLTLTRPQNYIVA